MATLTRTHTGEQGELRKSFPLYALSKPDSVNKLQRQRERTEKDEKGWELALWSIKNKKELKVSALRLRDTQYLGQMNTTSWIRLLVCHWAHTSFKTIKVNKFSSKYIIACSKGGIIINLLFELIRSKRRILIISR